jgi:hypothetical protein
MSEANKVSAQMAQEAEIARIKRELDSIVDEQSLYASSLFSKIKSCYDTIVTAKVAGFKDHEYLYSDIFCLGQFLKTDYYCTSLSLSGKIGSVSPVFFPITADGTTYLANYTDQPDVILSFLEELGEIDWFMGRNPDYTDYAGKNESSNAQKVCDENGNWDYVGKYSCNQIRRKEEASFPKHTLFKPYLVLNTNCENDPPTSMGKNPEFQYVAQCANRVNKTSKVPTMWETVRAKHIKPEFKEQFKNGDKCYNCLEDGIGFKGLVRETLLTTKEGKNHINGNIDEYISECLGKSGDIANYVAQEMGYSCWQELIFDLSPEGLFSFDDMINAVMNKELYTIENRLPIYAKLGKLGNDDIDDDGTPVPENRSFEDEFGDLMPSQNTEEPMQSQEEPMEIESMEAEPEEEPFEDLYGNDAMNQAARAFGNVPDEDDNEEEPENTYDDFDDEQENTPEQIDERDGSWTDAERLDWAKATVDLILSLSTSIARSQNTNIPDLSTNTRFVNNLVSSLCIKMKERGY